MNKYKIIALFGESGTGKDTIKKYLIEKENMNGMISFTSRPKRDNEINDVDYHFVTKDKFLELMQKKKILEVSIFNHWYYGSSVDDLQKDKINVGVFNIQGISNLLHSKNLEVLPIRIQISNEKERLIRALNREENPNCSEICRRFLADQEDLKIIPFQYRTFLNDKPQSSFKDFFNLIEDFIKVKND